MVIYAGATPSDKIIRLIKEGEHYDGCNSFKGFLNKSYFCDDCNRGYDHEDLKHHLCNGNDPDGISAKKKAEFERWYQEKLDANYHFVMQREMQAYCESDVKLLKAG